MPASEPYRILFVCMGNICRSPAAEGVLEHLLAELDLSDRVQVDSAGTIAHHQGEIPDRRMQRAAADRGYRLEGRARQVSPEDLERYDLIVAMDRQNLADLENLWGRDRERVHLFSEYLPADGPEDVPDPYFGGAAGFERVLDLLEEGCGTLLERVLEKES